MIKMLDCPNVSFQFHVIKMMMILVLGGFKEASHFDFEQPTRKKGLSIACSTYLKCNSEDGGPNVVCIII